MPNLVVYVPTSLWDQIENLGLDDPKVEARKVARGALEDWLKMQDEGRLVRGPGESSDPSQGGHARSSESVRFGAGSPGTDLHFKPDFK